MKNEYRTYNKKGSFQAAYGLGWNIADIMRNEHHLLENEVTRVELVINGKVLSSVTREELKKALAA